MHGDVQNNQFAEWSLRIFDQTKSLYKIIYKNNIFF